MIRSYLKYRAGYFILVLFLYIVFAIVHALYGYPLGSIYYTYLLTGFFFVIGVIWDYLHLKNKVLSLREVEDNLSRVRHEICTADNIIEQSYQDIIKELYVIVNDSMEKQENDHINQMEYYTMWVHQIKTPISAMNLAINNRDKTDHNLMQRELFKVEQYVEMALQYIKINRLSSDLLIQEYNLSEIITGCVKKYASLFIYKKLSIELKDLSVTVLTDSKWLSFMIEQILSNSIKYTQEGGVNIKWEENMLMIQDTGIGIRSEDMERIFEKGYTGYNGRLDNKASGIGLYLVKMVSNSLAIKINLQSVVGEGTKISLIFPADENEFVYE